MKAISIHQPWASLIAFGEKRFETRSWHPQYRGRILIHASKTFNHAEQDLCHKEPFISVLKPHGIEFVNQLPAAPSSPSPPSPITTSSMNSRTSCPTTNAPSATSAAAATHGCSRTSRRCQELRISVVSTLGFRLGWHALKELKGVVNPSTR